MQVTHRDSIAAVRQRIRVRAHSFRHLKFTALAFSCSLRSSHRLDRHQSRKYHLETSPGEFLWNYYEYEYGSTAAVL